MSELPGLLRTTYRDLEHDVQPVAMLARVRDRRAERAARTRRRFATGASAATVLALTLGLSAVQSSSRDAPRPHIRPASSVVPTPAPVSSCATVRLPGTPDVFEPCTHSPSTR